MLAIAFALCPFPQAMAASRGGPLVLVVTNTSDQGAGSLRSAMLAANAAPAGSVIITFDLPPATCKPFHRILLQSPLPDIAVDGTLFLSGYSQPGSHVNTLEHGNNALICVMLDGSLLAGGAVPALRVPEASATQLTVQGLDFTGFSGAAIDLGGGDDHRILGNRFGFYRSGQIGANAYGVRTGPGSDGTTIGGTESDGHRNTFGGSTLAAVLVDGSGDVEISNNYIGTNPDGTIALPNLTGIAVMDGGSNVLITDNVISGNSGNGILFTRIGGAPQPHSNVILRNRIGLKRPGAPGTSALGNGGAGVRIVDSNVNAIGETLDPSNANAIAHNGGPGVWIASGQYNAIGGNHIFANDGLGIDLAAPGVNPNDDDTLPGPPGYANQGQNYPVLDDIVVESSGDAMEATISGSFASSPTSGSYVIEVFGTIANPPCDGGDREGGNPLGFFSLTLPPAPPGESQSSVEFIQQFTFAAIAGLTSVTATATDFGGNTSEFSACIPFSGDLIFADGFES